MKIFSDVRFCCCCYCYYFSVVFLLGGFSIFVFCSKCIFVNVYCVCCAVCSFFSAVILRVVFFCFVLCIYLSLIKTSSVKSQNLNKSKANTIYCCRFCSTRLCVMYPSFSHSAMFAWIFGFVILFYSLTHCAPLCVCLCVHLYVCMHTYGMVWYDMSMGVCESVWVCVRAWHIRCTTTAQCTCVCVWVYLHNWISVFVYCIGRECRLCSVRVCMCMRLCLETLWYRLLFIQKYKYVYTAHSTAQHIFHIWICLFVRFLFSRWNSFNSG